MALYRGRFLESLQLQYPGLLRFLLFLFDQKTSDSPLNVVVRWFIAVYCRLHLPSFVIGAILW